MINEEKGVLMGKIWLVVMPLYPASLLVLIMNENERRFMLSAELDG